MIPAPSHPRGRLLAAGIASAVVVAQFVAGKATQDALYLANLSIDTLPTMVAVSALVSLVVAIVPPEWCVSDG
jgi:sulfite exporter TauE/SafE